MNSRQHRSFWIDASKGVGILLVVLGHNSIVWGSAPWLGRAIFLFHMPLFFFLTGTTLRLNRRSIIERSANAGAQYLTLSLLLLPLALVLNSDITFADGIFGILYGTGHSILITPLWFLSALSASLMFLGVILPFVLESAQEHKLGRTLPLALILAIVGTLIINSASHQYVPVVGWGEFATQAAPWNIDLIFICSAYILVGVAFSDASFLQAFNPASRRLLGLLMVMIIVFAAISEAKTDLNFRYMTPSWSGFLLGLLGTLGVVFLLYESSNTLRPLRIFSELGRSSLIILALHNGIQSRMLILLKGAGTPNSVTWLLATAVAVAAPYLLDRFVIRRHQTLAKLVYSRIKF